MFRAGGAREIAVGTGEGRGPHVDPLEAPATWRPNAYWVGPEAMGVGFDAPAPVYALDAAALADAFDAMARAQPRISCVAGSPQELWVTYVERSRMGFTDHISVRFLDLGKDRSTLAVFSRAGAGLWDFGVNRRRVEKWLAALERFEQ